MIPSGDIFKGGQPSWVHGTGGKGGRRMMTKGFKVGSYVRVTYFKPQRRGQEGDNAEYEGTIVDKRMSSQDRESHVTMKDVLKLDGEGRIVGYEKEKRVYDVYIEECQAVEKPAVPNAERAAAAAGEGMAAAAAGAPVLGVMPMAMAPAAVVPMGMMAMNPMAMMNPMLMMGMCGMPGMARGMAMPGAMSGMGGRATSVMAGMGGMASSARPGTGTRISDFRAATNGAAGSAGRTAPHGRMPPAMYSGMGSTSRSRSRGNRVGDGGRDVHQPIADKLSE